MTKIQQYHFGYVLEKVNIRYETIEEIRTPRITLNIFGQQIVVTDYHRIDWSKFIPGNALSQSYKNLEECKSYQRQYNENI